MLYVNTITKHKKNYWRPRYRDKNTKKWPKNADQKGKNKNYESYITVTF